MGRRFFLKYKLPAAALIGFLVGGGLYFYESSEVQNVEPQKNIQAQKSIQGYGVIDFERVKNRHPDGARLKELVGREARLKLELDAALQPYKPPQEQPEIDSKPFEESSREKNMQAVMERMSALKAKKVRLVEQFRAESQEEYLRRRDAVRSVYLNAALNITLKLQNADNLHLTQEEIQKLQEELEQITLERNDQQKKMLSEWTTEINSRVEQAIGEEERQLRQEFSQIREQSAIEAEQKIFETQKRNKTLTNNTIQEIESRQRRRRELLQELKEVTKEREDLEDKILASIVDETGKLAAISKLEMVFVKREVNPERLSGFSDLNFDFLQKKSSGAKIYIGKGATDLTKDLIKAMDLKGVRSEEKSESQ